MKITDRMRLNWLLNFKAANNSTIDRWNLMLDLYYKGMTPRKALDSEIRRSKRKEGA